MAKQKFMEYYYFDGVSDMVPEPELSTVNKEEEEEKTYKLSSVQIQLPEEFANIIKCLGENIPDKYIYEDKNDPMFGREDDPHVTVLYGLHTDNGQDVQHAIKDYRKFGVQLGEMSFFEADKYDVFKIEVHSPDLMRMNETLRTALEYTETHPEYQPHCTIAYVKKDFKNSAEFKKMDAGMFKENVFYFDELIFSGKAGNKERVPVFW